MNSSVERRPAGAVYDSVLLASTSRTPVRTDPVVPAPRPVQAAVDEQSGCCDSGDLEDGTAARRSGVPPPAFPPLWG